eukprot:Nitzschia sp. Nitz4//scaffold233_size31335//4434//8491//NITZ4_007946-RA/size31335-processed-gene-0.1-mRNA-1//1//CDS//3329543364//8394//frame0
MWLFATTKANTKQVPCKFPSRHHVDHKWPIHDLLTTELLLWLLPTHSVTHLIKFYAVLCFLVACLLGLVLFPMGEWLHPWVRVGIMWAAILYWVYWYYYTTLYAIGKPWMDPSLPAMYRRDMHVPLRYFTSFAKARRAACRPEMVASNTPGSFTPNVLLLDSNDQWQFQLLNSVEDALSLVYNDQSMDLEDKLVTETTPNQESEEASQWSNISVPSNWMLQEGVNDIPIYTNKKYPFPCIPPVVPRENPTGVYKRVLDDINPDWVVALNNGDAREEWSVLVHGAESACYVFWDGTMIGFCKDSRLLSEFNVSREALQPLLAQPATHKPVLHFVVARWSDGSYLEDQDHWWMAGLHRSVELVRRPVGALISDYRVDAEASGRLAVSVSVLAPLLDPGELFGLELQVQLMEDEQLTAGGESWKPADEPLWIAKEFPSVSVPTIDFSTHIPSVRMWTAETPNLYTLVLSVVRKSTNQTLQAESCRIGFRSIDIEKGVLRVNGKRITICGINRHEHDPDHGKVVSLDRMKQDITILKQNNFNAIRTSHYPNHPAFYRFCDFYGMYVCDEANIETDGMKPMGRLANDWGWEHSFVSRVQRMVQRDINHPCIILWSLGNESGRGRNFLEARKKLLMLDTSRPVCYEGGGSWAEGEGDTELTDIVCPMYTNVDSLTRLADSAGEDRPIVLCEYSHSMNNSNGNLHLYWEAFWSPRFPNLQGGFIWDFIDQGLRKRHMDGRQYFGYGGDFGDKINDRQFCINGMFSPDRDPHPCVAEIKHLQQPARIAIHNSKGSSIVHLSIDREEEDRPSLSMSPNEIWLEVENRYSFSDLSDLLWTFSMISARTGEVIHEGVLSLVDHSFRINLEVSIEVFHKRLENDGKLNVYLNVEGVTKSGSSWVERGHVVVHEQILLEFIFDIAQNIQITRDEAMKPCTTPITVAETPVLVTVIWDREGSFVEFDKRRGVISELSWKGSAILVDDGIVPNICRASTDNDRGGLELVLDFLSLNWLQPLLKVVAPLAFSYHSHWEHYGVCQSDPPKLLCSHCTVSRNAGDKVCVESRCQLESTNRRQILEYVFVYTVFAGGKIRLDVKVAPNPSIAPIPSLARLGIALKLDASLRHISYVGRGPHENYPDRKAGAHFGLWSSSPEKMGFQYIVPSTNGLRCDCGWICFESKDCIFQLTTEPDHQPLAFSAQFHSENELHSAAHTVDLATRENGGNPVFVCVDFKHMGLGGDVR